MNVFCLICGAEYTSNEAVSSHANGTNWGVCDSCLADARLGRMVRGMPERLVLWTSDESDNGGIKWNCDRAEWPIPIGGATPEEALSADGVKEVER